MSIIKTTAFTIDFIQIGENSMNYEITN